MTFAGAWRQRHSLLYQCCLLTQRSIQLLEEHMIVLSDTAFHAAEGDPSNLKLCERGEWQDRMLMETVLLMLTLITHFKKVMHWVWTYFHARLAFTMAAFNVLVS